MGIEIKYKNNKMVFPKINCDCGCTHNEPDMDVYIGTNILKDCSQYIKKRCFGSRGLLIADNITYQIAGQTVEKILRDSGFLINSCVLDREDELELDERALGEILLTMKLGAPTTAQEIGIDDELLYRTLYCSKDYRSRYTVFKTLDELGLLKLFIQEMKKDR